MTGGEVRIREQALPGIGHRFELDLAGGRSLVVVARRDGSRDVAVREGDDDATRGTVRLAREQAVAVGSLLLGARFAEGDLGTPRSRTGHLGPMTHHVGRATRMTGCPADVQLVDAGEVVTSLEVARE